MSVNASKTRILAEGSVLIALTVILKNILPPVYRLPQGGSVSAASMVPLLLFVLRRGPYWGVGAGAVYGLVHMFLPRSYVVDPIQALLDYPLAFAALDLAGVFRIYPLVGVVVGIFGRFLAHFVSGAVFFAINVGGTHPFVYSAIYNGGYLLVELLISVIVIAVLVKRRLLELYL